MSREAFEKNLGQFNQAIGLCVGHKLVTPTLVLIYSLTDMMGWISDPDEKAESSGNDFKRWVNEYLLAELPGDCTADDLWAARCAVVHTHGYESKLSEKREAREIYYAWGMASDARLGDLIERSRKKGRARSLHVQDLWTALCKAIARFGLDLTQNLERAEIVYRRADKIFWKSPPM